MNTFDYIGCTQIIQDNPQVMFYMFLCTKDIIMKKTVENPSRSLHSSKKLEVGCVEER